MSLAAWRQFQAVQMLIVSTVATWLLLLLLLQVDLETERQVTTEQGEQLARELNVVHYEASAQNDVNVNLIFHNIGMPSHSTAIHNGTCG
jgi:hypothetical protein